MKGRNHNFIVLMIGVTILVGVLTSFGMPALSGGGTPEVVLPNLTQMMESESEEGERNVRLLPVTITPETVQAVIATLHRPESYYRELTTTLLWGTQSATSTAQVWVDGGFTKTSLLAADGMSYHSLLYGETLYVWQEQDRTYFKTKVTTYSADVAQRIPTYEDVLNVDPGQIIETAYEQKNGVDCIFVGIRDAMTGYLERYWIETSSGLLQGAESEKDGVVFYRMVEREKKIPVTADATFLLPDGTLLHQVEQGRS